MLLERINSVPIVNIVTNIIWLYPSNASDFPNAVPMNDIPAGIGDEYIDGIFYHNNERILTEVENLRIINEEQAQIIEELDNALLDTTYASLVGEQ